MAGAFPSLSRSSRALGHELLALPEPPQRPGSRQRALVCEVGGAGQRKPGRSLWSPGRLTSAHGDVPGFRAGLLEGQQASWVGENGRPHKPASSWGSSKQKQCSEGQRVRSSTLFTEQLAQATCALDRARLAKQRFFHQDAVLRAK